MVIDVHLRPFREMVSTNNALEMFKKFAFLKNLFFRLLRMYNGSSELTSDILYRLFCIT
ncbi:MAG: hypothetical protein AOA65_0121 [Candidatus Bathyarchaeota archaeon BA1]|nr:MAG: hypothetical protein AOA65_0121 [Candidatus Bathyarchaeota archaeon BA1]